MDALGITRGLCRCAFRTPLLLALGIGWSQCSNVSGVVSPSAGDGGDDAGAGDDGSTACTLSDSDGITGGSDVFDVTVDDSGFSPILVKAQNRAAVTLTLTNAGTRPHDLVVDCLPTPNAYGCPSVSCFPAGANIPALAPGASMTTSFVTPNPEGIYTFRSDVGMDSELLDDGGVSGLWGQFVVQ
jgi:hypothetical protein